VRKILLFFATVLVLTGLVSAQGSITTTYANNNSGSTGWLNMFVFKVINPSGLKITSIDINTSATVLSTINIAIYTTPTTYQGKETSLAAWKLVGKGTGQAAGTGKPSRCVMQSGGFDLQPAQYGFAVHFVDCSPVYTNGTGTGPTGNQRYQNADCGILCGKSIGGFFTGTIFNPRVWNGTIHYRPAKTAVIAGTGTGALGTTYTYSMASANEPTYTYGVGSSLGNGPTPIDTRKLGLTLDGLLQASTSGALPWIFQKYAGALDTSGRATASLAIPKITALKGIKIYTAFVTVKASSPSGISSISNTVDFTIQ
jgi:hypothetical protein